MSTRQSNYSSSTSNNTFMEKGKILFLRERGLSIKNLINYGMGVLATVVSKHHDVKIIDNNARYKTYSSEDIITTVRDYKPDIICFSIATINAFFSYNTIQIIKKYFPQIPIVAGGLHISHQYQEALERKVDYVVRGEAELVILDLIDKILTNQKTGITHDINIKGVSYFRNGELLDNGICALPLDLDQYSIIDYNLYSLSDFVRAKSDINVLGKCLTQRGCPFKCTFCSDEFINTKIRKRSIGNILMEIEYVHFTYGVDVIDIRDADFTLSNTRIIELCQAIIERGLRGKLNFTVASDSFRVLKRSTLEMMRNCGFYFISLGIERMVRQTQEVLNKKLDRGIILENLDNLRDLGFSTCINHLVGFRFESVELLRKERSEFANLLAKYGGMISTNIFMPTPGTKEYEIIESEGIQGKKWYLNPTVFHDYKPFYQLVYNLLYDLSSVPIYPYGNVVNREIIKTKVFFIKASIRKKSRSLLMLYYGALILAKISEWMYSLSPFMERLFLGNVGNWSERASNIFSELWVRDTKRTLKGK
ncbi:TPA: hypothetical protein DD690_02010 [Candidatus Daviesbacteria bacterium]|nr:hypothetical protein [Candidatus Daviesbacteria bacterium]